MREPRFADRVDAGRRLAAELAPYSGRPNLLVLALPRGGVPVAFEVAQSLRAPLDVFLVRKLGVPGQEELAMGAIASGGIRVLNSRVVSSLGIDEWTIDQVAESEQAVLQRREQQYRGDRPDPEIRGRTVILVDDGVATGSTMRAAVAALRTREPERLVVAVPVAPAETCEALKDEVDDVVCVITPADFNAVGQWYDEFPQTSDDEVHDLLVRARHADSLRVA